MGFLVNEDELSQNPPYDDSCDPSYCLNPSSVAQLSVPLSFVEGIETGQKVTVVCSGLFAFSVSDVSVTNAATNVLVPVTDLKIRDRAQLLSEVTVSVPPLAVGSYSFVISAVRSINPAFSSLVGIKQKSTFSYIALKV